jgi:hypothetical protein
MQDKCIHRAQGHTYTSSGGAYICRTVVQKGTYIRVCTGRTGCIQIVQDAQYGSYNNDRVVGLQEFVVYFCFYSQWAVSQFGSPCKLGII